MLCRRFQLSPRALRFFVAALAVLQLVAPTWHICEMGGPFAAHTNHSGAQHAGVQHSGAQHSGAHFDIAALAAADSSAPEKPLICFCAAHEKAQIPPDAPRLDGRDAHHHATCLAMLLQTLPAQLGAPPQLPRLQRLVSSAFSARFHRAPAVAAPRRFLGRAPPEKC